LKKNKISNYKTTIMTNLEKFNVGSFGYNSSQFKGYIVNGDEKGYFEVGDVIGLPTNPDDVKDWWGMVQIYGSSAHHYRRMIPVKDDVVKDENGYYHRIAS
jgi:hypothetical protein